MLQEFVLYVELSVMQNLNFVAGLFGARLWKRCRRVREALEFVKLCEDRRKTTANISGGMRRRLQLAAAIVHDSELLFVGEPTANLDPILRHRLWDEFRRLREEGRTLFVITQYVGEAELCDRVGLLSDGTLVAVGTTDELRRRAFGDELIQLALGEDSGHLGVPGSPRESRLLSGGPPGRRSARTRKPRQARCRGRRRDGAKGTRGFKRRRLALPGHPQAVLRRGLLPFG
jgi:ABC-2 type transport system ATP-binding protein